MTFLQDGVTTSTLQGVNVTHKAARVSPYPNEALGHYLMVATSGLLTTIAAGTATAGHIFVVRAPATNVMVITRLAVKWRTVVGFSAAQEVFLKVFRLTGFSANYSGGTDIVLTTPQFKKRASYPSTTIQQARIGSTGALTAGTQTLDTNEFASDSCWDLAAGATVPKKELNMQCGTIHPGNHPLVLTGNEGFIVRNEILMGAAGTGRLIVEMDWFETATY